MKIFTVAFFNISYNENNKRSMEKDIEKAIRETIVIKNKKDLI